MPWLAIVVAWVIAGSTTAVLFHYQLFILQLFGRFVGVGSTAGGAVVVMVGSLLYILVFVLILQRTPLARVRLSGFRIGFAALVYGSLIYLVGFGVGLPVATRFYPVPTVDVPYLPVDAFVIHLLFGLLVGASLGVFWSPGESKNRPRRT